MPDFSAKSMPSRAELLVYLLANPNVGAFDGNRNGPVYKDDAQMRSWKSLQSRPDYDEQIERAMYANTAGLKPSAQQMDMGNNSASMPPLKYMPEMRMPSGRSPLKRTPQELAIQEELQNRMMNWGAAGPIER